jgi:cytochrome P450
VQAFPLGAAATLEELEADPHPLLARLRSAEPVSWVAVLNAWLVTRRDLALQVMRDDEAFTVDDPRFSTGQVVGPSMLTRDGAEHARHRDPFARPFRLDAVRARYAEIVDGETGRLLDEIAPLGRAELRRALAGPLAVASTAAILGLETTDAAQVLRWYDAIVDSVTGVAAGRPTTEAGRLAFEELRAAIEPSLVREYGDALQPDELVSNAAVLLFGGIETTEGMIANALLHLLTNPDQLELVVADAGLLANAVEESLRLEPATAVVDRYATRDVELGRALIRKGDLVTVSIAGANRDPATFPDPDRFDVRREIAKLHVAFAQGPHVCIGMHLARLEAHSALAQTLERLPNLRLEEPAAARGLVFRKPPALNACWN